MIKQTLAAVVVAGVATAAFSAPSFARDQIRIVGSSTVFPFSTAVAEQFGKTSKFKTPVVESTGSGGGMKLFCSGIGVEHPDITNASRRIKASEFEKCTKNGIKITEVKIGFDGIVLANAKQRPDARPHQEADLPGAGQGSAGRRQDGAEPLQEVERHRSVAARRQDRGAGPAADQRHP